MNLSFPADPEIISVKATPLIVKFCFHLVFFRFFTNMQRKYLSGPVPDHTGKHKQKLRRLQHRPQNSVHESERLLHPDRPGQDRHPLFTQHRFKSP